MLKDLGSLYQKSEIMIEKLNQSSGVDSVRARMHQALDQALDRSLKKIENLQNFQKHFQDLKTMNQVIQENLSKLMEKAEEMDPNVMMEQSQLIFSTRKNLEELAQFKTQKVELRNDFREIVRVLEGCVSMFFLDIMEKEQEKYETNPVLIQPLTQSNEIILFNSERKASRKQFGDYHFPKNFAFLNLKEVGIMAGGWREGKELDEFIEISRQGKLRTLAKLLKPKYGVSLSSFNEESQIFVIGGFHKADLKQVDIFSMKKQKWMKSTSLTTPRYAAASCEVRKQLIFVFGGYNKQDNYLATIERYSTKTGGMFQNVLCTSPDCFFDNRYSAVQLAEGRVLLFGGYEQNGTYEVRIKEDGTISSFQKLKGAHINHLSTHTSKSNSFKVISGMIWASDESLKFRQFVNNQWV